MEFSRSAANTEGTTIASVAASACSRPCEPAPSPVARPLGRGWMQQGSRAGGPRPRVPGARRNGVRGPGAQRPPCAEACLETRPETARGPHCSRRPR